MTNASAKKRSVIFALKLVVAIILIVGAELLSVWLAYHSEQSVIAEIEAAGGIVETHPAGPVRLRNWFGNEHVEAFRWAYKVDLSYVPQGYRGSEPRLRMIDDDVLKRLGDLTSLQILHLSQTQITDSGFKHLSRLTSLKELDLDGTKVTDIALEQLNGLTHLENLYLDGRFVSDEGVNKLRIEHPEWHVTVYPPDSWESWDINEREQ